MQFPIIIFGYFSPLCHAFRYGFTDLWLPAQELICVCLKNPQLLPFQAKCWRAYLTAKINPQLLPFQTDVWRAIQPSFRLRPSFQATMLPAVSSASKTVKFPSCYHSKPMSGEHYRKKIPSCYHSKPMFGEHYRKNPPKLLPAQTDVWRAIQSSFRP